MKKIVKMEVGGKEVTIESGRMAKQADGSVIVTCENNVVLVTVVSSKRASTMDFFPLTVEYSERFYSTGKIPGGYFKREGRPTNEALLNCRLIDRPLRPCFPEGYRFETQIVSTILSSDGKYPVNSLAGIGASAALHLSDIPFAGPTASLVVGRIDGKLVANPTLEELENSDVEAVVAASRKGILMVEGESQFISEAELLEVLNFAHKAMEPIFDAQDELRKEMGNIEKRSFSLPEVDADFVETARGYLKPKIQEALKIQVKLDRYAKLSEVKDEAKVHFLADLADLADLDDAQQQKKGKELGNVVDQLKYELARSLVLDEKTRIDGRNYDTVRPIACEVGILPRVHGGALFTRGETQVLGTVTLGTPDDEQKIDSLGGLVIKKFLLHYNFPPFCVGETGRMGGQSRREIGHGFLAERALKAIVPSYEEFPYTLRVVSEVLESNGSSSMGTVCAGTLALLDAGVPIKGNVAGIAMGLIKEGDNYAILSDILGDEDHLGDMDFKLAGTREGITSFQMDIKVDSISAAIMEEALGQAKVGRNHILDEMEKVMKAPRGEISEFAPRIETIQVKPEKVRDVIGAGGKVIKSIIEQTGVKINIDDDGKIHIASVDPEAAKAAIQMINDIVAEAQVGKSYKGKVVKITDFGAFVEILPNNSGLLHISELAHERVRNVTDVIKEGEMLEVKVLDVDRAGRIKLSRKALLPKEGSPNS